jgi:hypothetical protein
MEKMITFDHLEEQADAGLVRTKRMISLLKKVAELEGDYGRQLFKVLESEREKSAQVFDNMKFASRCW